MIENDAVEQVSSGRIADNNRIVQKFVPRNITDRFEVFSYRNAAAILASSFPEQFSEILAALDAFSISETMIRTRGGSKGPIASYVDTLFGERWIETRISADLNVKLLHARKTDVTLSEYRRRGFLDGHRIDFVNEKVALDLEWNSKDQTYDRDLTAFSAFYDAGAIDVGVILTRGSSLDNAFFKSLGKVLNKDGSTGSEDVFRKYGASTTWMGKLLYRLDAGRNGGCPVLAIGITPECVVPG
ncbi:MAG: hypothetical protein KDA67_03230 [Rhodobacteraceae bacterium]|nr:hypothetical protein [Paracoccaceae bacterium]